MGSGLGSAMSGTKRESRRQNLLFESGGRWILPPGQSVFLALLLLLLLGSYWIRGRSGFLPWLEGGSKPPPTADSFVVEIDGPLVRSGIYTFPTRVGIEEVLLKAGAVRELIPREVMPRSLKTGTCVVLRQSSQGLTIRMEPMDPAKRLLYAIPLDLNGIEPDELTLIPGIGPTLAKRIVCYRNRKGSFTRLEELLNISGIGSKKLESLRRYLSVESSSPPIP